MILKRKARRFPAESRRRPGSDARSETSNCYRKSGYLRLRDRAKRGSCARGTHRVGGEVMGATDRIGFRPAVLSGLVLALAMGAWAQSSQTPSSQTPASTPATQTSGQHGFRQPSANYLGSQSDESGNFAEQRLAIRSGSAAGSGIARGRRCAAAPKAGQFNHRVNLRQERSLPGQLRQKEKGQGEGQRQQGRPPSQEPRP